MHLERQNYFNLHTITEIIANDWLLQQLLFFSDATEIADIKSENVDNTIFESTVMCFLWGDEALWKGAKWTCNGLLVYGKKGPLSQFVRPLASF